MSIDCRYFTNGTKTAYTLKHTDTGMVEEFEKFEEIPVEVREYFKRLTTPKFCGPDLSTILGLNSVFYPDWPKAAEKKAWLRRYQGSLRQEKELAEEVEQLEVEI